MNIDLYILAFSAVTVAVTIWMGFRSAKKSKTASDFFVAGRSVGVGMNASAISGEYLSAASFMGIAGMVMSSGYDALWYPVCYACGYLFLLLFIAGPLRRFGAYTIPDFAEGRFDSPVFRKIAVVFVLFIGFFYTMPQMKGAGTTLAYIFPGLPYWAGVVLVGAVITLNVALGGMKGITLVQAFQYWAKMFAISVPIFVLMAVYGHYGKQVGVNGQGLKSSGDLLRRIDAVDPSSQAAPPASAWQRIPRKMLRQIGIPVRSSDVSLSFGAGTNTHTVESWLDEYSEVLGRPVWGTTDILDRKVTLVLTNWVPVHARTYLPKIDAALTNTGVRIVRDSEGNILFASEAALTMVDVLTFASERVPLPAKAPADATWLNPFGPLTTKAAKNAAAAIGKNAEKELSREGAQGAKENALSTSPFANFAPSRETIPLRAGLSPDQRMTVNLDSPTVGQALTIYGELTGRRLLPNTNSIARRVDDLLGGKLSQLKLVARTPTPNGGVLEHADGAFRAADVKSAIEAHLRTNGIVLAAVGERGFAAQRAPGILTGSGAAQEGGSDYSTAAARQDAGGTLEKAWLAKHEKPLALLYTYSLIIAIVCGTAGLPHILVRFYTNPDGVAAKKTTMWVMILIGVFYVFPPVFGALGRNLLPDLYNGVGAKGTDKIVLELPRILNEKYPPLGSILSGITCAGAFAAFMSTFSGLLVSMTGALAHDVYGRIFRPKSTPEQRMRMFKIGAVLIGGVSILLGMQVEQLQINFMVGQAFAIAAASYFPLLFMAVWWRGLTMKGAATGMLTGGVSALLCISLTSFSDLAAAPKASSFFQLFAGLNPFWAAHPLLRILAEQPAIWAVPLAITLMIIVSKLTARTVPGDVRMKMLVLHAPEQLGLKQEYIQEHSTPAGH